MTTPLPIDLQIAIFLGTSVVSGQLSANDIIVANSLATSVFRTRFPWQGIIINDEGLINYANLIGVPPTEREIDLKRNAAILLAIIIPVVALILLILYGAWQGWFPPPFQFPTGGPNSSTTGDGSGENSGENNRNNNNTDENTRTPPNLPNAREFARNGREALRDMIMRGRHSGQTGTPQLTQNQVYEPIPLDVVI